LVHLNALAYLYSHAETPKYRCPRCKTQTCSLPCYKRHQQRAACSGKRDPGAYVKKNDLATPAGVDRDYNYLKGVERSIEDAAKATSLREDGVESRPGRLATASRQPNSLLAKYLERNLITVKHAPAGMSRQRSNQTRYTKSGKAFWTVEWIDEDDQRNIQDDSDGSTSLGELYGAICKAREKTERRRLEEQRYGQAKQRRGVKRKHEQNLESSQRNLDETTIQNETAFLQTVKSDDTPEHSITELQESSSDPVHIVTDAVTTKESPHQRSAPPASQASGLNSQKDSEKSPERHYYLAKPMTRTSLQILIPLDPHATLTDSLRDQTVLEYPTIYVFLNPVNETDPNFMLEANYRHITGEDGYSQLHGSSKSSIANSSTSPNAQPDESKSNVPLDANSILKMLKRDIAL
jgi:hypothetical protein